MNKLILGTFFALCCLTAVRGLQCNNCAFRFLSICFKDSIQVDCPTGACAAISTSIGSVSLFKKLSCNTNCTSVTTAKDGTFGFDYTTSCCSVDLCNSASAARLSHFLGFAMVAIWLTKLV